MQPNHATDTLLPRAVRRQMQGVKDRLEARSAAQAAPATTPTAPAAAPTATTEPTAAAPNAAPSQPAAPAPSAPSPGTADARENSVDYWRDRFRVMQGVNEKQRNDHADALAARDQELADLRARLTALEKAPAPAVPGGAAKLAPLFFTPEQIERFGEDSCEAMAATAIKAAQNQAQQIIDAEVKPLKEARQADDAAKAKQARQDFLRKLDELVAKIPQAANRTIWEINAEQAWLDFLDDDDEDGEKRQAKLSRFERTANAQGIANLVKQYLTKTKATPPTPPVAPGGGAGAASDQAQPGGAAQMVNGKGYPTAQEFADYTKRSATIRNPRDPRYVKESERQEMEARLRLPRPPGR